MKTYQVVSFVPKVEGGVFADSGEKIEKQIADVINQQAAAGWEFVSYQTSHVVVKPGCIAGLIGRKQELLYCDVMIFSK